MFHICQWSCQDARKYRPAAYDEWDCAEDRKLGEERLRATGAYLLAWFTFDTSQSSMMSFVPPDASMRPSGENATE
jgi:hypothetical protein